MILCPLRMCIACMFILLCRMNCLECVAPTVALDTIGAHNAFSMFRCIFLKQFSLYKLYIYVYRCCNAVSMDGTPKTCSSPNSLLSGSRNSENFCPSPPKVSVSGSNPSGLLDSENAYITEYLLDLAMELDTTVFFRQIQAGFTITKRYNNCSMRMRC